jgi:coenzyme F420 biosynthesis associated uncharacterized protein
VVVPDISWETAEKVASALGGRTPHEGSYHYRSLGADFEELTALAVEEVSAATGMSVDGCLARSEVLDRPAWVRANVGSIEWLFGSLAEHGNSAMERFGDDDAHDDGAHDDGASSHRQLPTTPYVLGAGFGAVFAWMSKRVLGQYDLLVVPRGLPSRDVLGERSAGAGGMDLDTSGDLAAGGADLAPGEPVAGGTIYYVGPNVVSLEKRYGFAPRQFRLWIALHEVTHWLQFANAPWLKEYLVSLVRKAMGSFSSDPERLAAALKRLPGELRARRARPGDLGMMGLLAEPEQLEVMRKVQGIMSLLEGHGNFVMNKVGSELVSDTAHFNAVLKARRDSTPPMSKVLQRALGFDVKLRQYEQGEAFVATVEATGGSELLTRAWAGPENLPSLDEVRSPLQWVSRIEQSS